MIGYRCLSHLVVSKLVYKPFQWCLLCLMIINKKTFCALTKMNNEVNIFHLSGTKFLEQRAWVASCSVHQRWTCPLLSSLTPKFFENAMIHFLSFFSIFHSFFLQKNILIVRKSGRSQCIIALNRLIAKKHKLIFEELKT